MIMSLLKPDMGKIVYLLIGAVVVPMVLPKLRG
jgi:hypothetical protein